MSDRERAQALVDRIQSVDDLVPMLAAALAEARAEGLRQAAALPEMLDALSEIAALDEVSVSDCKHSESGHTWTHQRIAKRGLAAHARALAGGGE